ncbi:MAG: GGDEF domain-containing protein [Anaerolineales bacterium]|nr:GGDEF domain-containing protein [Anaerolineales bacterium]
MRSSPITIGMLPGWPVYGSIFLDRFLQSVIGGVRAAAHDNGCNLIVACGVSRTPGMRSLHTAWPVLAPDCDYVPLGHWNTDGLIVAAPLRSEERSRYLRTVIDAGFPVVFIGSGEGNPSVIMDNEDGIRQAVEHLIRHGHRRIAFVAGDPLDHGDSAFRLQAYRNAIEEFEAISDPRLVAYGYHYREGGRKAMEQILNTAVPFTAVVASNDVSAFGAMEMLKIAGRRIPMDVAVIGFDDQPAAAGQVPPLTSVHYPQFDAGVKAVEVLLESIAHPGPAAAREIRIPAWLAIRESCGCSPSYQVDRQEVRARGAAENADIEPIGRSIQDTLQPSLGAAGPADLAGRSREFVSAFLQSIQRREPKEFYRVLEEILDLADPSEDFSDLWQSAVSILRLRTAAMIVAEEQTFAENMLHQARLTISDHAERLSLRKKLSANEINHQIGWMTTRMFSAGSEKEILRIFAEHLAEIGIRFAQVALFEPREGNPLGAIAFYCNLWHAAGEAAGKELRDLCVDIKDFPTPDILPAASPYSIALLPIVFQDEPMGFAIFDAGNLEPLATIIRQLGAALKTQELHSQAEDLTLTDPSTGVQNRRFFDLFLQRELERSRRYHRGLTIIMVNLDGWTKFASEHGPVRSRGALGTLAQTVSACVRRGSDMVCRYTSDTFAIMLPETDRMGAQAIAAAIRENIEKQEAFQGAFDIGIGIVLAETECPCKQAEELAAATSRALDAAKAAGRNRTEIVTLGPPARADKAPRS